MIQIQQKPPISNYKNGSKKQSIKKPKQQQQQQQEPGFISLPARCQRGQISSNINQNFITQSQIFQSPNTQGKGNVVKTGKVGAVRQISKKKDALSPNKYKCSEEMTIKYVNRGKSPCQQQYFYDQIIENKSCVPNFDNYKTQEAFEKFQNKDKYQQQNINLNAQEVKNNKFDKEKQNNQQEIYQTPVIQSLQQPDINNNYNGQYKFNCNNIENIGYGNMYQLKKQQQGKKNVRRQSFEIQNNKNLQQKLLKFDQNQNQNNNKFNLEQKDKSFKQVEDKIDNLSNEDLQKIKLNQKQFSLSSSNFSPSKNKTESLQNQENQQGQNQLNSYISQTNYNQLLNSDQNQDSPVQQQDNSQNFDKYIMGENVDTIISINNQQSIEQNNNNIQKNLDITNNNINDTNIDNNNNQKLQQLSNYNNQNQQLKDQKQENLDIYQQKNQILNQNLNINNYVNINDKQNINIQNNINTYNYDENINQNNMVNRAKINSEQNMQLSEYDLDNQYTQQTQIQHSLSLQNIDIFNEYQVDNPNLYMKNKSNTIKKNKKQSLHKQLSITQSDSKKKLKIKTIKSDQKTQQDEISNNKLSARKKLNQQFYSRLPSTNGSPDVSFVQKINNFGGKNNNSFQTNNNNNNNSSNNNMQQNGYNVQVNIRLNELNNLSNNTSFNNVSLNEQKQKQVSTPQKQNYSFFKSPNKSQYSQNSKKKSNKKNLLVSQDNNTQDSQINSNICKNINITSDLNEQNVKNKNKHSLSKHNNQNNTQKTMISPEKYKNKTVSTHNSVQTKGKNTFSQNSIFFKQNQKQNSVDIDNIKENNKVNNKFQSKVDKPVKNYDNVKSKIDSQRKSISFGNQSQFFKDQQSSQIPGKIQKYKKVQSINVAIQQQIQEQKKYQKYIPSNDKIDIEEQQQQQINNENKNNNNKRNKSIDYKKQQDIFDEDDSLNSSNQNRNTINITNLSTTVDTSNLNLYSYNNTKKQSSIKDIEEEEPQFEYPKSIYPKVQKILDKINQHLHDPQPQYSSKELEILKNVHNQEILQNNYIFETDYNIHQFLDSNPQNTKEAYLEYRYKLNNYYIPPELPAQIENDKKYTIVLDMDETLIHCLGTKEKKCDQYSVSELVIIRPYVHYFLEVLSEYYEIVLFTAAIQHYADSVIDQILDPENKYISHRFYREHCRFYESQSEGVLRVKDITKLGRDMEKIILIDDKEENIILQKDNSILCNAWQGEQNDTLLYQLVGFLKSIVQENGNVQIAIKFLKEQQKKQNQKQKQKK